MSPGRDAENSLTWVVVLTPLSSANPFIFMESAVSGIDQKDCAIVCLFLFYFLFYFFLSPLVLAVDDLERAFAN